MTYTCEQTNQCWLIEPLTQLLLILTATENNATDLDMENVEISNICRPCQSATIVIGYDNR